MADRFERVVRDDLDQRLARFETLVERTAPAPADCRCTCDRCTYARGRRRTAAA